MAVIISTFILYRIKGYQDQEIRRQRDRIRSYKPGSWTSKYTNKRLMSPSVVKIGVFGVQGHGKSSLLNSITFAYKGIWEQVYAEGMREAAGGETIYQDPAILTPQIVLTDTRGLVDLSEPRVQCVMDEIRGKRGIVPGEKKNGDKIDCPIFVFEYSPITKMRHCQDFLQSFVTEVKKLFGSYPIMVITHSDIINDKKRIRDDIVTQGMSDSNVFFIENYTKHDHKENKKKHLELLEILRACIKRADDNIIFNWRKENKPEHVRDLLRTTCANQ